MADGPAAADGPTSSASGSGSGSAPPPGTASTRKPPPSPPPFLPPDEQIRETLSKHQIYIQVMLFVIFVFFATILLLGRLRYRGGGKRKLFATKLFIITTYLVSYIPGLMSASDASSDIYLFWIAFVPYLAAVANEISCYTLGDNEERRKRLVIDYCIVWPLILKTLFNSLATPEVIVPVLIIFWVVILKLRERTSALLYATKSSDGFSRSTQIISDFANYEDERVELNSKNPPYKRILVGFIEAHKMVMAPPKPESEYEPESDRTAKHLDKFSSEFITLDLIYKPGKTLISEKYMGMSERKAEAKVEAKGEGPGQGQGEDEDRGTCRGKDLRDTCFAFTMFSHLLAKIGGYENVDVKLLRNGEMVKENPYKPLSNEGKNLETKILPNNSIEPAETYLLPNNSFELVDKELMFLYQYFFTNYYAIYERGAWKKVRDFLVITLFFILTIPLLVEYRSQSHSPVYVVLWHGVLDNGFTRFVILAILTIEFVQIGMFLTSNWAKVMYTCSYIGTKQSSWPMLTSLKLFVLESLITIAYYMPRPRLSKLLPWAFKTGRIGQYEILKCHSAIPLTFWCKCWVGSYVDVADLGQSGDKKEPVTRDLEKWILESINTSLLERQGEITNGKVSLRNLTLAEGNLDRWFITEGDITQPRVVLVWHLATSYLIAETDITSVSKNGHEFKQIATTLSKYNAYMVALFPQLFSDQVYATRCVFNETVRELRKDLISEDPEDVEGRFIIKKSIVNQGKELKEKLKSQANVWEILAKFWTERLFFLALSDHDAAIEAHIDRLCVGGEFITRVWALLTHAGCTPTDEIKSESVSAPLPSTESQDNQTDRISEE